MKTNKTKNITGVIVWGVAAIGLALGECYGFDGALNISMFIVWLSTSCAAVVALFAAEEEIKRQRVFSVISPAIIMYLVVMAELVYYGWFSTVIVSMSARCALWIKIEMVKYETKSKKENNRSSE